MTAKHLPPRGPSPLFTLLLLALTACGEDPTGGRTSEELQPFVGTWSATSLVQTSTANPGKSLDLVAEGATFSLEIQANGRYHTLLDVLGVEIPEDGRVEVEGQELVFFSDASPTRADPATYQLSGDRLILEGASTFDFPNDEEGTVPTTLRIELTRV